MTVQQMKEAEGVAPLENKKNSRMGDILLALVSFFLVIIFVVIASKS